MNLKDLKYLVSVSEHRHFGKAAEACFVSQPALSMQIKKLEDTLGMQLFERTNKSVMLTESGMHIVEHAKQILNKIDEMYEIAKLSKDPYAGELRIGIFPTLAPYLLPLIMPKLAKKFPRVSFYLTEKKSPELVDLLRQGKLHAAFLALPILDNHFKIQPLFKEEFLLCTSSQHELSGKSVIKHRDLQSYDILLLDEGHCLREQALSFCHLMATDEVKGFRATSLETLRHMVGAGIGVTLMPKLACQKQSNLAYISFKDAKPSREIGLVWRVSGVKNSLLSEIGDFVKELLCKINMVDVL